MAKKTRRLGQRLCPSCNKWIKGTRWKACPHCGHEFQPKATKAVPAAKPAAKPAVVVEVPAPAKPNGTITLEQIKKVAATVKALGGFQKMTEVLAVIKEAGGVKKFKDLAEAMQGPAEDVVPF
jgi:hypothetical protein